MSDLISRADAIEAVRKELVCDGRHETHDKTCRFIADVLLSALPSADAIDLNESCEKCEHRLKGANEVPCCYCTIGKSFYTPAEAVSRKAKCCPIAETCMSIDCPVSSEYIGRPSAEAVQGEWVRKYDDKINCYWYECDQCGEYRPRNQFGHEYDSNFCPHCGARMKGGDSE